MIMILTHMSARSCQLLKIKIIYCSIIKMVGITKSYYLMISTYFSYPRREVTGQLIINTIPMLMSVIFSARTMINV